MSQYVQVIEEEEDGIGVMKALAILSANEHRSTSQWRLVEEQHFKNGRLDETHIYVTNHYDRPDQYFETTKFLVFEVEAIAKSYVMENIESQLAEIRSEKDDDNEDSEDGNEA
jgi:hypothetical protein